MSLSLEGEIHVRTQIFTRPQSSTEEQTTKISGRRMLLRGAIGAAAVATLAVGLAGTASAATDDGTVDANVAVGSAITLTGLTPSFLLTGLPGATVPGLGAVTFNVATNNLAGYSVTVQSAAGILAGTGANTETIPIGALSVRETGTGTYTPLSDAAAVTVHTQGAQSTAAGNSLSNDYQVVIPFVNPDTYSATLNYVATTL
jgi:hypothetical protein